jgi:hypothetical protein
MRIRVTQLASALLGLSLCGVGTQSYGEPMNRPGFPGGSEP